MKGRTHFFNRRKKNVAAFVSATMLGGMLSFSNIPTNLSVINAAEYDLYENFDNYEGSGELKGFTFGSPSLALTEDGVDGSKGLAVTGRTSDYFGYAYDVSKYIGNKISLTAKVSVIGAEATDENQLNAKIKLEKSGADDDYVTINSANVVGTDFATISGEYEIAGGLNKATIYFDGPVNVDYVIDDISVEVVGEYNDPSNPTVDFSQYEILKDLYADYFKLGVACEAISNWQPPNTLSEIGNPEKEALIKQEFNSITFGNELKPAYNMGYKDGTPGRTETNLPFVINPAAKEMLDWAKDNGIKVRGHVLVWHSQCAEEIFCENYTPEYDSNGNITNLVSKEVMIARMDSYINNVMDYMYSNGYGDVIYAWDVVNEAIEPADGQPHLLRNSYWYQTMGEDFMYYAFKSARTHSVEAANQYGGTAPKLFYNDYNEYQANKRDAIIAVLTDTINGHSIKGEGLIDGVGMQAHVSDSTNLDTFMEALEMYEAAIGEVHLTELDVAETSSGVNADYYQAVWYNDLFKRLVEAVDNGVNVTSVTIWGLTDDNSWKVESSPLIFNGDLSKKLAFDAIVNAVTGEEMPEPEFVKPDLSDMFLDFEDVNSGFWSRGDGEVVVQKDEVFDGKGALLDSGRTATWNGASFDVSRFAGQTIDVSAWVKSEADEVKVSADIDGVWPNIAVADTSDGEWVQIKGRYSIPKELNSLSLYFEASDLSDIYIDAAKVKLVGLDEGFEESSNIATPRGQGHMPVVTVTDSDSKSGENALKVTREAQEATVNFNVSSYIGQKVIISTYVKTNDSNIAIGLDGDNPYEITNVSSNGDWTLVEAEYTIPGTLTSANIYVETNGNSDMYIDDFSVRIADVDEKVDANTSMFTTRWGGAGTLSIVEDGADNYAVKLSDRDETYYGTVFDMSAYIGMEVEVSFDVKTDDSIVKLSGDIDGVWPNYLETEVTPGEYNRVGTLIRIPNDLSSLRVYIETNGNSDLYIDNLVIRRVAVGPEYKVTYDLTPEDDPIVKLFTEGYLITQPEVELDEDIDFTGWYKDSSLSDKWNFGIDKLEGTTTLYAFESDEEDEEIAPKIKTNPSDVFANEGANATFTVEATGNDLKYQWLVNKGDGKGYVKIENANSATLKLTSVTLDMDGYKYICEVSNKAGNTSSNAATLHVKEATKVYDVIEGANGTFDISNPSDYKIVVDADYDKFLNVTIDNEIVDPSNYTVTDGTTVVTFKASYLEKISTGTHSIVINFSDGYAKTNISVINSETGDTGEPTTEGGSSDDTTTEAGNGDDTSSVTTSTGGNGQSDNGSTGGNGSSASGEHKTGDFTALGLLSILLMLSGAGLVFVSKKKKNL